MHAAFWTSCLCVFYLCSETTMLRVSKKVLLSISSFPHPYPLVLAVNKSPAVFVFLRALHDLFRENRRSYGLLLTCCFATFFQHYVSQFLKENVFQTISKLREKYEGCDAILRKEQQVRE